MASHQAENDQDGRYTLGNNRSQRHSGRIHMKYNYKKQIQEYIDDPRGKQKKQRPPCVAYGAQNGSSEVIYHLRRHSDKNNAHI